MLQKMTQHRWDKVKSSSQQLGSPDNAVITSANRTICRSWLNGLGIPSHLYDCATLVELQEAYRSCATNYIGLKNIIAKEGLEGDTLHYWTREAAGRAYVAMFFKSIMPDPAIVLLKEGQLPPLPLPEEQPQPKKEEKPMTTPNNKDNNKEQDAAFALTQALTALQALSGGDKEAATDEKRVIELIKEHSLSTKIEFTYNDVKKDLPELHHSQLPEVAKAVGCECNVMLVGPAGSGKTTLAAQIAKMFDLPFYFNGALSSEYKLTGFMDANGKLVRTPFREAYEHGGVYLFDEIDGSMPDALLAFNAALSNGHADFPDGTVAHIPLHHGKPVKSRVEALESE